MASKVRLWHLTCALYIIYLDSYLMPIALEIFTTRKDIVNAHWVGLSFQFYTVWNQAGQQIFSLLVFALDVIVIFGLPLRKELKVKLRNFSNDLFMYVVFPSAITVALNFWLLYSFLESNVIEDMEVISRHVPRWANHCLHTYILLLPALEILVSRKPYPSSRTNGVFKSLIVVAAYIAWVTFTKVVGGRWPYPFLALMSPGGILLYTVGNIVLSCASYLVGHDFNNKIWRSKKRV